MGRERLANNKATSQACCKRKGKMTTGVPPQKKAKGNNISSIVTTKQGHDSRPKHKSPADHPLFRVRRYIHKNHSASDLVLHVKVTDHLSYKNLGGHIKGCGNYKLCCLWFQNHLPGPIKDKVKAVGFSLVRKFTCKKWKEGQTPHYGIGGALVRQYLYIQSG